MFGLASSPRGSPSAVHQPIDRRRPHLAEPGDHVARLDHNFYDKNWITRDTLPSSPHYGNCYVEYDDFDGHTMGTSTTAA